VIAMSFKVLVPLALELRERLDAGAFAGLGRVELSDGTTVNSERMARIILADVEHIARNTHGGWLMEGEEQTLHDDLLRLLALAHPAVRT